MLSPEDTQNKRQMSQPIHDKPTASIILSGKNLKAFSNKARVFISPFHMVLKVLEQ